MWFVICIAINIHMVAKVHLLVLIPEQLTTGKSMITIMMLIFLVSKQKHVQIANVTMGTQGSLPASN